jgi:hypothetical protein
MPSEGCSVTGVTTKPPSWSDGVGEDRQVAAPVMAFTVTNGRITQFEALLDPERLAELDLTLPDL